MKFKYLNGLADIVVNIDEDKNIFDGNVIGITEHAIRLIAQMKQHGLNVGTLQETFAGMQVLYGNRILVTELIDIAHEEIARLLGKDAWRVYGCDEGGWFFQTDDACEKAAA